MKRYLSLLLICLLMCVFSAPAVAAAPPGRVNNMTGDSRLAFSPDGVYVLLSGKLYYYDYAAGQSVLLREVDLVDDHYRGQLNGTPLDFQRYYEMADNAGFVQWYDDQPWLLIKRQAAADVLPQYFLRRFDRSAEQSADWIVGVSDSVSRGLLHRGRFFYLASEQIALPDGSFTGYSYLCETDLTTGENRSLDVPLALEQFTLVGDSLYFLAKPLPDPATFELTGKSTYALYKYDLDAAEAVDLGIRSEDNNYVFAYGDKLIYSDLAPAADDGADSWGRREYFLFDTASGESSPFEVLNGTSTGMLIADGDTLVYAAYTYSETEPATYELFLIDAEGDPQLIYREEFPAGSTALAAPLLVGLDGERIFLMTMLYRDFQLAYRQLRMLDLSDAEPAMRTVVAWEK